MLTLGVAISRLLISADGRSARGAARGALQPRVDATDVEDVAARQQPHALWRRDVGLAHGALAVAGQRLVPTAVAQHGAVGERGQLFLELIAWHAPWLRRIERAPAHSSEARTSLQRRNVSRI
jgi:hypothetical protein